MELALERKAHDVTVLDLRGISTATDYFVVASGNEEGILNNSNDFPAGIVSDNVITVGQVGLKQDARVTVINAPSSSEDGADTEGETETEGEIETDWEHTEYHWLTPEEIPDRHLVPKLKETLASVWE